MAKEEKEAVMTEEDERIVLSAAATLLQIDHVIMDIYAKHIDKLLDRLSKYEDVGEDRKFAEKINAVLDSKNNKEEEKDGSAE